MFSRVLKVYSDRLTFKQDYRSDKIYIICSFVYESVLYISVF